MIEIKKRSIKEQLTVFLLSDELEATYISDKAISYVGLYNGVNKVRRDLKITDFTCSLETVSANRCIIKKKQKLAK